jgi:hypothetical protein
MEAGEEGRLAWGGSRSMKARSVGTGEAHRWGTNGSHESPLLIHDGVREGAGDGFGFASFGQQGPTVPKSNSGCGGGASRWRKQGRGARHVVPVAMVAVAASNSSIARGGAQARKGEASEGAGSARCHPMHKKEREQCKSMRQ